MRRLIGLLAALTCAALLGACGGDDEGSESAPAGEVTPATLKVGVIPIADVAPLYLGVRKGFFAQEKLTI